jgi:phage-related protein
LFIVRGSRVIVLHAFQKKTRKTPVRAMALAWKRAKDAP